MSCLLSEVGIKEDIFSFGGRLAVGNLEEGACCVVLVERSRNKKKIFFRSAGGWQSGIWREGLVASRLSSEVGAKTFHEPFFCHAAEGCPSKLRPICL